MCYKSSICHDHPPSSENKVWECLSAWKDLLPRPPPFLTILVLPLPPISPPSLNPLHMGFPKLPCLQSVLFCLPGIFHAFCAGSGAAFAPPPPPTLRSATASSCSSRSPSPSMWLGTHDCGHICLLDARYMAHATGCSTGSFASFPLSSACARRKQSRVRQE